MEDWNEGDEQARLLSMLPEAWIKRVTKGEAKRAKSNHMVKMMLPKEYHTNMVAWTRKNVARDVKRHSLQNALPITVSGDREKTAMWRLDECDVSGQTIRLQAIPARMSCDEILEWVGEEVLKEYRNLHPNPNPNPNPNPKAGQHQSPTTNTTNSRQKRDHKPSPNTPTQDPSHNGQG